MSILKCLTATLSAQADQLVGEIENHDAVVAARIRGARRAYATARVRLGRLTRDGERLRERLAALRAGHDTWRGRAAGCDDEQRGLECLRRAGRAAAEADALAETLTRHEAMTRRLAADVERLRRHVDDLEHRRRLMRSRCASADAAARLAALDGAPALDLDDTFERWEIRITESEVTADAGSDADGFAADFDADEEETALRAELRRNRHQTPKHDQEADNAR
jgi:phage shock protein A